MSAGISIPSNWQEVRGLIDSGWRLYHSKQVLGTRYNYAIYATNDEPGGVSFSVNLKHGSADLLEFEASYLVLSNKPFVPSTILDTTTNTFVPNTVQLQQTSVQSVVDPVTNNIVPLTEQQVNTVSVAPSENLLYLKEDLLNLALSNEMAVNGLPTTTYNIWDGSGVGDVGTPDWAYSSSGVVTEEVVASHSGTNGLKILLDNKKYVEFSGSVDVSLYNVFSFWVDILSGWEVKDKLDMKLYLSGSQIGKKINVRNYLSSEQVGFFRKVVIPICDFNKKNQTITNIDKVQFKADGDKYFYFDDFKLSTNGSGNTDTIYKLSPQNTEKYFIDLLNVTIITSDGEWEPLGFGNINQLQNGIKLRVFKDNSLFKEITIKNNSELLSLSKKIKEICGNDNVKSFDANISIVLDGSQNDWMEVAIDDNLSGIISIKSFVLGGKVDI